MSDTRLSGPPREARVRPSGGQERLWFLEQLAPGAPACHLVRAVRITGPLEVRALERSLNEIAVRHEILRAAFPSRAGEPTLVIAPKLVLRIPPVTTAEPDLPDAIAEEVNRPFQVAEGPLIRCKLLCLAAEDHALIVTIHHIVTDDLSMGILFRELGALYNAFSAGRPSPLPPLTMQFAHFAGWQRRHLEAGAGRLHFDYWKRQLRGSVPVLDLPTDRPREAAHSFKTSLDRIELSEPMSNALKAFSRTEGVTLFMTLLAAFQVLLHRHTLDNDILVGSPLDGRTRGDVDGLIGCFVNIPLFRSNVGDNPTFRQLVARVRGVVIDAQTHQEISLDALAAELDWRRNPRYPALFNVLFHLRDGSADALSLDGLGVDPLEAHHHVSPCDLSLSVVDRGGQLIAGLSSNRELFERDTSIRMLERFRTLLDAALADPDAPIWTMPLLGSEEYRQVLGDWNQTRKPFDSDECLHQLVEAQVERTPDAIAVCSEEERLTYRELNARANQLAHYLRKQGVGPDVLVGVSVDRSPALLVSLLAITKAGGAYLPLDPAYPRERLAFMLHDARAAVLLKQARHSVDVPASTTVVCIDADWPSISRESDLNPAGGARPEHLAYVIYTSGSTGSPKGVMIEHRSAVNCIKFAGAEYGLTSRDRVLQFVSVSFDASVEEIWAPLTCGSTLMLRTDAMLASASAFLRQCGVWKLTVLVLPAAYWHELAAAISDEHDVPATIRCIIIGGESVRLDRLQMWRRRVGRRVRIVNQYGPTEATVFATACDLAGDAPDCGVGSGETPIGRPIWNTRILLLDEHRQPVPVGVKGEIYIAGAGLARGYLNRSALTEERFIRNPFDPTPGARLYRTGDIARYLSDGSIQIAGRTDQQVKVRGFRVELGEIEAALARHPSIAEAVVVARSADGGPTRLTAYVSGHPGRSATPRELREHLKQTLPDYMIPAGFVSLDSLPRQPNGKIDRSALRQANETTAAEHPTITAPRTSLERDVAEIWAQVLGVERVGIQDNFFDLGGDSLLSIQLIARIEKRFAKTLPAALLFQSPTIEQLAAILGDERQTEAWSSLIPVQPAGTLAPFFWIHGDSSNAHLPEYLGPDRPLYALEHQAHDGRPAQHTEVETITNHYLKEVRRIRPHGPYLLGGYSFGAAVAFEMAHQLTREGEDVSLLFLLDPPGVTKKTSRSVLGGLLQAVRGLERREQLTYLLARVKNAVRDRIALRTANVTRQLKKLRWKAHLLRGQVLPPSLRSAYILDVYRRGFSSYVPNQYPGRVVIFKCDQLEYCPPRDWPGLTTGGVDIHEAPGGHMDMMQERYVAMWAPLLKEALEGGGYARKPDRSGSLIAAAAGESHIHAAISLLWMAVDCMPFA